MKNLLLFITLILSLGRGPLANAGTEHQGHDTNSGKQSATMKQSTAGDISTYSALVEGVSAQFQVMSLASMNIKDPQGNTHHVMVKFFNANNEVRIKDAVGKVKVIKPSGEEQINSLKNYSGVFAANFTFDEKGKYGVICLFKVNGKKRLVKFWYPHG